MARSKRPLTTEPTEYDRSVFINCPFDEDYRTLFEALVFTILECGYHPRSAKDRIDSGEIRIRKITNMIEDSRLGIHDISRIELDRESRFPRFNMPLELGLFMGAKEFGRPFQQKKKCLIFESKQHSSKSYCSDIGGQDPAAHGCKSEMAVRIARDWLHSDQVDFFNDDSLVPSGQSIHERYQSFDCHLADICEKRKHDRNHIPHRDLITYMFEWIEKNRWIP